MEFLRSSFRAFALAPVHSRHVAHFVLVALSVTCLVGGAKGDSSRVDESSPGELQKHYDAARTFQISGAQDKAAAEYKTFLANALGQIAIANAQPGKDEEADKLFAEAMRLAPDSTNVNLDFAALRLQQGKAKEAQALAERALKSSPDSAGAEYMLGSALFQQNDYKAAKEHLEKAVVANPKFELGYLLGITYLKLNDLNRATLLFNEMVAGLGDTPEIHILFSRAYREGDFLDQAIQELRQALAKDSKIKTAHYLIAMASLERDGDSGFAEAVPELQAELKVNPDDARTHYMLGYVALKRHDDGEAERELKRAAELDSENPDPLISLGQLLFDSGRLSEAEKTFLRAIALTPDPSRNGYQINRAHYGLGRILLQTGREDEGRRELRISAELRDKPHPERRGMGGIPDGPASQEDAVNTAKPKADTSPGQLKTIEVLTAELRPAIADSYNNLGVIAASKKDYALAMDYFFQASQWEPGLETLDRNLGMAAFYANRFDRAIGPLGRHVEQHPDDVRARAALGLSFFGAQNYKGVIQSLQPIEKQVDGDPGLSYAYGASQVKAGAYEQGIARLRDLEKSGSNSADLYILLGEAFADQGQYADALNEYRKALSISPKLQRAHFLAGLALVRQGSPSQAAQEFRESLTLAPADVSSKYHLAYSLIEMQQQQEALGLLREVIRQDPKHADAYYQLGKLELEHGDTSEAISNLEAGTRLSPDSDYLHYQLALAYRRSARDEDAQREMKIYQALKNRHRGRDEAQVH